MYIILQIVTSLFDPKYMGCIKLVIICDKNKCYTVKKCFLTDTCLFIVTQFIAF